MGKPVSVVAFDVDNTLNIGPLPGPVDIKMVEELFKTGKYLIGICGNFDVAMKHWPDWYIYCTFFGGHESLGGYKPKFLQEIMAGVYRGMGISDFIMVGNRRVDAGTPLNGHIVSRAANDDGAARLAGWKFAAAQDFPRIGEQWLKRK